MNSVNESGEKIRRNSDVQIFCMVIWYFFLKNNKLRHLRSHLLKRVSYKSPLNTKFYILPKRKENAE